MSEHVLKVTPTYMDALLDGSKTFEIRRNDRGFQRGDDLVLWEYDASSSGRRCEKWDCRECKPRSVHKVVSFVFSGDPSLRDCGGIAPGYVVLGLADWEATR